MDNGEQFSKIYKTNNFHFAHTLERLPDEADYFRHNHFRYELYVCFEGDVNFTVENRNYRLTKDELLLIKPLSYHFVHVKPPAPYRRLVLNFEKIAVPPELHTVLEGENELFARDNSDMEERLLSLERRLAVYRKNDAEVLLQVFLNELLLELKYAESRPAKSQAHNASVSAILQYVNEHIYEPVTLTDVASHLFLNPSYVSQLFSEHMKIGLADYVKQKKIFLAQEMIQSGAVHPTEASKRLGFQSYPTFYRLFKKYVGSLPSEKTAQGGEGKQPF